MTAIIKGLWAGALALFARLIASMATSEFLEWAFFYLADRIVKRTDTPHDDAWLAKLKETYQEAEK